MLIAYKYRVYPNQEQKVSINKHFGCVRYIYNQGLSTKIKSYEETGKSLTCFQLTNGMLFVEYLKYKSEWYGRNLFQIGRFEASSKTCSVCGEVNRRLTLKDREWICDKCGVKHDRDINASLNVKKFGLIGYLKYNSGSGRPGEPVEIPGSKQGR